MYFDMGFSASNKGNRKCFPIAVRYFDEEVGIFNRISDFMMILMTVQLQRTSKLYPVARPRTVLRPTHLLQELSWEVFNHHPPYNPELAPSYFYLFLYLKKFLFGQRQGFQNERERRR